MSITCYGWKNCKSRPGSTGGGWYFVDVNHLRVNYLTKLAYRPR